MTNEWRPIAGFEDYYSVNRNGEVLSHRSGKLRKLVPCPNGYLTIVLCGKNKKKTTTVHRLVASAFVPNPNGYEFVNHIDENKHNNVAENLEWCTKAYNNNYNGKTQRCCKRIVQIDPLTRNETVWPSARKAARAGLGNYKNISAVCRGLRPRAGGYEWRFDNG